MQNICVVEREYEPEPIASTAFAIVHPYLDMPGGYFKTYFRSPVFVKYVEAIQTGIAYPAINDKQFFSSLIPLPPLEEQKRIVAKVEELMHLCDELEEVQKNNLHTHQLLVSTLLDTLTQAKDAQDLNEAWQLMAAHFDMLFCTEDSIELLKQTILQLAVMGRLVPQDPKDEPASELLKKIAAEKAKHVKEGKIKKEKPLPEITEEEKPLDLPKGWEWVRLGDLCSKVGSGSTPRGGKEAYKQSGVKFLRSQNIYNDGLRLENVAFIDEATQSKMERTKVVANDILLNITGGSIGRCALIPETFDIANVSQHVTIIRPLRGIKNTYLHKFILSPHFQDRIMEVQTGGNREGLAKKNMQLMLITLPPREEQKRIVAKVEEVMMLCNALSKRIQESEQLKVKLSATVVQEAAS